MILLLRMLIGQCLRDEANVGLGKKERAGQELGRAHRDPNGAHNPTNLSKNSQSEEKSNIINSQSLEDEQAG